MQEGSEGHLQPQVPSDVEGLKPEHMALIPEPAKTEKNTSPEDAARTAALIQNEKGYVDANKGKKKGLEARYADDRSGYDKVQKQLDSFKDARKVDVKMDNGGTLSFSNSELTKAVEDQVQLQINKLFTNPEKNKMAAEYVKTSLALFARCKREYSWRSRHSPSLGTQCENGRNLSRSGCTAWHSHQGYR